MRQKKSENRNKNEGPRRKQKEKPNGRKREKIQRKEKEGQILEQEQQEAATLQEMTGQAKKELSEFGGGFNLDMPTIERPGYETETRPQ